MHIKKNIFNLLGILFKIIMINILFINNKVLANPNKLFNNSYLSIDALVSKMPMHKKYGGNVFSKDSTGINLAFGKMFNKYFGLEVGGSIFENKTKFSRIDYPDFINGIPIEITEIYNVYKAKIKRRDYYLGLTSKLHINDSNSINFLIGAALVKINTSGLLIRDAFNDIFLLRHYNNKNKICPTFRVGYENKITNNLGLNISLGWIKSKQNIVAKEQDSLSSIKIKNTTNVAIGINYYL